MYLRLLTLVLLCSLAFSAQAQFVFPALGARSAAMGGASMGLDDLGSAADNIAGTAFQSHNGIGLSYQQHYLMKELPYLNLAGILRTGDNGAALLRYGYHGSSQYNEQQVAGGYALKVTQRLALGVTVNYLHAGCNDPRYESKNHLSCAIGMQYRPNNRCIFGVKVFNPIFLKSGNELVIDRLPVVFNMGVGYKLTSNFTGTLEVEKNIYQKPTVRMGAEYCFWEMLYCRAGFATQPNCFGFGVGFHNKRIHADISAQMHPTLGLSPMICLVFE